MTTTGRGHRIEISPTGQHITVSRAGVVLAETREPVVLHETGCPPRYYIRPSDVRTELLVPSDKHTTCPFKGEASYWSLNVDGETVADLVWGYPDPIPEAEQIKGLLCFYNEKVDLQVENG